MQGVQPVMLTLRPDAHQRRKGLYSILGNEPAEEAKGNPDAVRWPPAGRCTRQFHFHQFRFRLVHSRRCIAPDQQFRDHRTARGIPAHRCFCRYLLSKAPLGHE